MQIVTDTGHMAQTYLQIQAEALAGEELYRPTGDVVEISREAMKKLHESNLEPLVDRAMSLESIENRIQVVRGEIEAVWNSSLPLDERLRQVEAKKNEISLLQAGQFAFAKAGFYRA